MNENGRVTTREFHSELQAMRREMSSELKEIRKDISEYHVGMAALTERVNTHGGILKAYSKGLWLFGSTGTLWVLYEVFKLIIGG